MTGFVYKWTKITSVFAIKGCEHIENGIIKQDDLMQTVWTPLNFECPPVNFLLRKNHEHELHMTNTCLLYTSPSPRDVEESRMPSSA